jgi:hypothetical protein
MNVSVKQYNKTSGVISSGLIATSLIGQKVVYSAMSPLMPIALIIGIGMAAKDLYTVCFQEKMLADLKGVIDNLMVLLVILLF